MFDKKFVVSILSQIYEVLGKIATRAEPIRSTSGLW
jgi:hypothetical protein